MKIDHFDVRHFVDPTTGTTHRIYTYKRRPCSRIHLKSRLADQLSGYTLIEKDLRNSLAWLAEIEARHDEGPIRNDGAYHNGKNRENYTTIKGLFVALLTFYGKCFSKCEGRPVKMERAQLDERFHKLHNECIEYRHNFAAHSGAKKLEHVEVALIFPKKQKRQVAFKIYRELLQPDLFWPKKGELSLRELIEHAREIANRKIDLLAKKIIDEEVVPNAEVYLNNGHKNAN